MIVDFAERAHNHNWDLDPVVRSLLDTDFYKLLMLQFIWKHFPTTQVSFTVSNRSSSVRLAEVVEREEISQQLEHVRSLRFLKSELIWLAGNTFFGRRGIFEPDFLEWLAHDFRLSSYRLTLRDGQFHLEFDGLWTEATMWEIYALSIINELKSRAAFKGMSEFQLDMLYAQAKAKLWGKIERLTGVPELRVADFGTRRRHSFLWQEYVVMAMNTALSDHFAGTSNTYLAYKHNLEAVGTNAHELPMALAAMANSDDELKSSQYRILELWQSTYGARHSYHAARHLRHNAVSGRCAGLDSGLDRPAHRQQGSLRRGRRIHRLAEAAGPGSKTEADHRVRRHGCRRHPRPACLFHGNHGRWAYAQGFSQCGRPQ